jgi:hypothetical protein
MRSKTYKGIAEAFKERNQFKRDFVLLAELKELAPKFGLDLSDCRDPRAALQLITHTEEFVQLEEEDILEYMISGRTERLLTERLREQKKMHYDFLRDIENI